MDVITEQTSSKNDTILKIIDKVLNQIFGKDATTLLYRHLESNYSLKRSEIGDKIELFAEGLESFFRSGAYVIERKILEDINSSCSMLRRTELENIGNGTNFVSQMKLLMDKA